MAENEITPDDLIALIVSAAGDTESAEVDGFEEIARNNVAAFREQERSDPTSDRKPQAGFVIPVSYRNHAETFLVFDAFVAVFMQPLDLAVQSLDTFAQLSDGISSVAFQRFGESESVARQLTNDDRQALLGIQTELRTIALALGATLFGNNFNPGDFWGVRDTIQG